MFERIFEKEYFNIRVKGKTYDPKKEPKILKKFNPEIQQAYRHAIKVKIFLLKFFRKFKRLDFLIFSKPNCFYQTGKNFFSY